MNSINRALDAIFDVLLTPLEAVGNEFSLIIVSGVFGVLALIIFKHISSQKGIKAAKDKIKGHMIEIRLYQNDLGLVSKAIGKVLVRNLQYVGLNFGPFIPLALPFAFVVAQMVVRYGFEPVNVQAVSDVRLAGEGTTLKIEAAPGHESDVAGLTLTLPDGLEAVSPLVRAPSSGLAYQEFVATRAGNYEIVITMGGEEFVKLFTARVKGEEVVDRPRALQGERVSTFFAALLWPAEDTFSGDSGLARVSFVYPESALGWLPMSGPMGVILWFLVSSMAFGFAALKPLGVQI